MAFDKVDQAVPNFPQLEQRVLRLWKDRDIFARTLEESRDRPEFVFYEGPPTANGMPHNGHVLTRVIKDLFPRYMTMRGYHVERRAGWDTHGLPVEVEVEKQLRIRGKEAILEYGVDRFAKQCLESVFKYTTEWEHLTERIGFWVDLEKAYVTFHKSYIESVWWALSELFKKKLLYQGHKVVWWWAQGGTALSAGEVGGSYRTVDDPSAYVRFPLVSEDASLVVWTTTPWTLPSNMFVGAHADFDYAYVKDAAETLVLADALVPALEEKLGRKLEKLKVVKGSALFGKRYKPPFDTYARDLKADDARYFRIVPGDRATSGTPQWFVTLDSGTGLVHMAPAFGEDDWKVWRNERLKHPSLEMFCAVRPDGKFDARMSALGLEGVWVKDADKSLLKVLKDAGLLAHAETYRHEYPFCPRADNDPLIQYARSAWFIQTTSKIDQVMTNNQKVTWAPEHIQDGRFGDFLASNVDWALSRERFWGTPLNIWVCDQCEAMESMASTAEIEKRNPAAFSAFAAAKAADPTLSEHLIVHKPWIDQVTFGCQKCKGTMKRVPEVIDCWFDSGCMPFAQFGYPHLPGSKEQFARSFPADFISEAIDQTRGWFYSLMAISTLVFEKEKFPHPFKRCIVLGHIVDKSGKKESKSVGNYTPPEVILDAVAMEFAPIPEGAPAAAGVKAAAGTVYIGRDDLEGLDLKEGGKVVLYKKGAPESKLAVTIQVGKKLPRRVVLLAEADREALGLGFGPVDVMPKEVPSLPAEQRVMIEAVGVPAPGADAFRWFFYASNPPWNNTRHALSNVRGLQKELTIKLRNVYSFFVTYANIDGFDPKKDEASKTEVKKRPLLDRWVLSELEKTKQQVTAHMDEFRSYEATQVLSEFVEGLSNWYVRRSRDRFWAEGRSQDKLDAYWTLYQTLRDLSLMLAPFLPFAAEDMYQSLVVKQYGEGHAPSVHLRMFPTGDQSRIDEALSLDMKDVRDLVSLGLQVRASHKLKTRQPLKAANIVLSAPARKSALLAYAEVMKEELNVEEVTFLDRADAFVSYKVKPNFQSLGKRLGPKMKATQAAIGQSDPAVLKAALDQTGEVRLIVDDEEVSLSKEDLLIVVEAKEGFAAASAPVGVVILDTKLDQRLLEVGTLREALSKIQGARKEAQLEYTQRIELVLHTGSEGLAKLLEREKGTIAKETLCHQVQIQTASAASGADGFHLDTEVDGEALHIHLRPSNGR